MSSGFRRDLLIFAAALILSAHASSAGAHQKGLTVHESQVVETVSTIFAAARTTTLQGSTRSLRQSFTCSMEERDSTETPSWPSSRPNMTPANAMNGT
jgi:hypothetical protein